MAQPSRSAQNRARRAAAEDTPRLRVLQGGAPALRLGPLGEALGFHLRLAQEASFAAFARRTGESGLKPGFFATLAVIHENPGLSQTALGNAVGRDKSTLTPRLAEMERAGLIRRGRSATDRRSYALTLTPAGEEALSILATHAAAHDAQLDALVGPEIRAAFLDALRRLNQGLEPEDDE
ncbi:MarR family winged helix-turn-helix transcriptional regulator [Pararoseomonas indoligenes]|uniref:MarR family winged helix-turn-helix transcriptional regulator n=1 Tax=Roseomonas indoligenes TaxID=2820811 RepID=UPI0031593170